MKVRHGLKDRMLWVGDSINCNVNFDDLSAITRLDIVSIEANYVSNDAASGSFSDRNVLDVVEEQLKLTDFNFLVLGGGTTEVTNLDTTSSPEERLPDFKEAVFESSRKLLSIAEAALHTSPSLEKVIILRKPPRFDLLSVDPLQLKPQLSKLGDAFLFDLWCNSDYKDKILLADHQIPHLLDDSHHNVFGHPHHQSYDGVHMHGPAGRKIFKQSVLNILSKAGIFKPQQKIHENGPAIPFYPHSRPPTTRQNPSPWKTCPPSGRQPYNPLKILRERVASMRLSSEESSCAKNINTPLGYSKPPLPMEHTTRPSVIKPNNLDFEYSVPVKNHFAALGN